MWTRPLIGGAAVFSVGWGIAGFCPGGALPAVGTARHEVFVFVAALVIGNLAAKRVQTWSGPRAPALKNQERELKT
ncbi:DUF6691 family protein [Leisingera methylohalidivorans]|uniref:DUF6691 family protein n=1 Tax=Leisingera methylohalidivorans TaxID=133924 RepID=UPI00316AE410